MLWLDSSCPARLPTGILSQAAAEGQGMRLPSSPDRKLQALPSRGRTNPDKVRSTSGAAAWAADPDARDTQAADRPAQGCLPAASCVPPVLLKSLSGACADPGAAAQAGERALQPGGGLCKPGCSAEGHHHLPVARASHPAPAAGHHCRPRHAHPGMPLAACPSPGWTRALAARTPPEVESVSACSLLRQQVTCTMLAGCSAWAACFCTVLPRLTHCHCTGSWLEASQQRQQPHQCEQPAGAPRHQAVHRRLCRVQLRAA